MLTITKPEANRVDVDLSGKISSDEMAKGLDDLLELSQDVNKGKMLYTITSFAFPDLGAIAVEMARLPKLFGLLGRFDRCAVLSDTSWLRTAAEVEGALIPGFDIKAFDLTERDDAEAWLKTGCVFRGHPATDSESIRPPIPILSGHRFRSIRPPL